MSIWRSSLSVVWEILCLLGEMPESVLNLKKKGEPFLSEIQPLLQLSDLEYRNVKGKLKSHNYYSSEFFNIYVTLSWQTNKTTKNLE